LVIETAHIYDIFRRIRASLKLNPIKVIEYDQFEDWDAHGPEADPDRWFPPPNIK